MIKAAEKRRNKVEIRNPFASDDVMWSLMMFKVRYFKANVFAMNTYFFSSNRPADLELFEFPVEFFLSDSTPLDRPICVKEGTCWLSIFACGEKHHRFHFFIFVE